MDERVSAALTALYDHMNEITGKNPACPFCGGDEWTRGGDWIAEVRIVNEPQTPPLRASNTTTLTFTCAGCGFLRLHEVDPASWGRPGSVTT